MGLLFLLPGGLVQAQSSDGPIMYAENGTGAVATFTAIDPEGESIVWSLDDADAAAPDDALFAIENGVLRFKSPPDFENPQDGAGGNTNTYLVTVQASDGGTATTAMEVVTVEVTNVEEPGTVTLDRLRPQVGVVITATLADPDTISAEGTVTWQWYRGNSPIAGATMGEGLLTSMYTPAAGDVGSALRATAMYDDDEDEDKTAQEDSAYAVREVPTSNVPPTFPMLVGAGDTNQTREVAENTPAGTNIGAPVTASDTDVLTYSLNGTGAESFDINRATGQLITKAALDAENMSNPENDEFTVMVKATDPFGAEDMATVTITVTDVNEAPSVEGAASIDHPENSMVLDVDASDNSANAAEYTASDPDVIASGPETLSWSLTGADASKFAELTGTEFTRTLAFKANPDYESPGDSDGNNVYEVTVVVTDTKGNTDEQAVMVKVTNTEEMGVVTLSTLQPRVGFLVTATLTDPDNITADSLSWQWYRTALISILDTNFTIFDPATLPADECDDTNTENCSIKGATSAAYVPMDGDVEADGNILTAVATYTDGNGDGKDYAATASANNVLENTINDAPVFPDMDSAMEGSQTAQERSVGENVPVAFGANVLTLLDRNIGAAVTATTDDGGVLTYSLGGLDAASFSIMRDSGQLQTKAVLDKETKDTYTVTVTATDSFGTSSTITVTIKVGNVDEMPELVGEAPEEYAENGTSAVATFRATDPEGKSITWTLLEGTDAEAFSIVNGVLRFTSPPDYEAKADQGMDNTYDVTIRASDGGADTTATKAVSIDLTNVEEPGTITLSTLQPQVSVAITAALDDPDEQAEGTITWQWYRGSSPISGAVTSSYTPATGDVGSVLRAKAMYNDGEDEDKTAQENSYRSVRSAPQSNTAPVFPIPSGQENSNQTREVAENTPSGRSLGAPVAASDPGDVLTYSLSGARAAAFDINRVTGQLSTKAKLDYEDDTSGNNEYIVTVTATDPFGTMDMSMVTITVTDVNEAPMVKGAASIDHTEGTTTLDVGASNETAVPAEYTATDADADDDAADLKWSLTGADASKFAELTGTGFTRTLAFKANPDYESPGDSDGNNVYEVTVVVTDSKRNTDEQDVTVKVTNVEETGTVTLSTLQPRVGFPVTATLADADNITAGSVSWQWYRGTIQNPPPSELPEECATAADNQCAIKDATSDTYTPVTDDITDTLSAVATYADGFANEGDAKDMRAGEAANEVLADTRNKAPVFPDQDDVMEGRQTAQELMIAENVPVIGLTPATQLVRIIDDPVKATDSITANDGMTDDETLTYSLGGPDAASFSIDRTNGQLSTKVELDKETKDTYTVTVTATDPSGETATVMVTIKVTNVDEPPEIMVGGLAISGRSSVEYAENGLVAVATYTATGPDAAMATWMLEGDDAGDFMFSGGMLTFRNSPDYENPTDMGTDNMYMVTIMADDGTYMDTHDVMVMVTNVDEMGEVTLWAGMDALTMAPQVDKTITGAVMDPDGNPGDMLPIAMDTTINDVTWQWYRTTTPAMMDSWVPITGATDAAYMVTAGDTGYYLRVMATYTDAAGTDMAMEDSPATMMVTAMMTVPMFDSETATREVAENTAASMDIGDPVMGTDADGDTLTYTLVGTDAASFDIDPATGQLMTRAALDYETKVTYSVMVTATDPDSASDMITVTITVTNVDEMGMVTLWAGVDALTMAPQVGDTITGAVMDPDGNPGDMPPIAMDTTIDDVTWQWSRTADDMDSRDMDSWMPIEDATDAAYMVTEGDTGYYLRVMATYTDAVGTDMAMEDSMPTMMVVAEAGNTLLDRYDANDNNEIDLDEVFMAIDDYFDYDDRLTLQEVYEIVDLYFES